MNQFISFIKKEFRHILRDKRTMLILLVMPVAQIILFGFAVTTEVKNVNLVLPWAANQSIGSANICVIDNDRSVFSERLFHKITSSGYFILSGIAPSYDVAMDSVESGSADIIFEIENGFEKNLVRENAARVMISANAVNGIKGG